MITKDQRQQIGINTYIKAGAIGTLHYVMRFGKTRTAIKIAIRYHTKYPFERIIVLVPSDTVRHTWTKALGEHATIIELLSAEEVFNIINVTEVVKCGLLIVDEIHKFTSDKRHTLLNNTILKYTYNLGLTGTYPFGDKIIEKYFPIVDTITQDEALENKWISNFIEYNVPLDLTAEDREDYIVYSNVINNVLDIFKGCDKLITDGYGNQLFDSGFDVMMGCRTGRKIGKTYIESDKIRENLAINKGFVEGMDTSNAYNKMIYDNWNPNAIKANVNKFHIAMTARNRIHNTNEIKLKAVLDIYNKLKDNVFIIFNESIEFANIISDSINNKYNIDKAVAYHSEVPSRPLIDFITKDYFKYVTGEREGEPKIFSRKKQLHYIMEMMKINRYNVISTVNTLDESLDIPNIDTVITTSGTINPMQYSQRSARGKTINIYNPKKVTIIINLYFKGFNYKGEDDEILFKASRDETKLRKRQNDSDIIDISLDNLLKII